jgi:3-oxoacyl-[acyl-carrier protein] reductase
VSDLTSIFGLAGRTAVVTGGATGLGRATAQLLVEAGARVVIAGRRAGVGEHAAAEMGSLDVVRFVRADVTDLASVEALFDQADAFLGGIDVLVNSAGVIDRTPLPDVAPDVIDALIETNLRGVVYCCRSALPRIAARGGGAIVNIASYLAFRGGPGWTPLYNAAKAGVVGLTTSLAVTHGPQKIRVNALCPGFIPTDLNRAILENTPNPDAAYRRVAREFPLRRLGTPEDVAYAALFLASDAGAWITGVALPVDGGAMAR